MKMILFAIALATPAYAQTCPPVPDQSDMAQTLMSALQHTEDAGPAKLLTDQLWQIWATAPDAMSQEMLDRGMRRREAYDFDAALAAFDELVAYCPDYAEGYNQRAFINFIRENYDLALQDLHRATDISPHHIAALAGIALTLMRQGKMDEGQVALRRALTLNPWLPERGLLIEKPGEDI